MSEFFKWDAQKYSIQVPAMDGEHQILIGHMNQVHSLHQAKARREATAKALNDLISYTKQHFADEEAYLEKIEFPDRRVHAVIHKQLLGRVDEFAREFAQTGVLTEEFFVFLKTWLKAHICGIDTKYAEHGRAG